jgi:hypothetical protein
MRPHSPTFEPNLFEKENVAKRHPAVLHLQGFSLPSVERVLCYVSLLLSVETLHPNWLFQRFYSHKAHYIAPPLPV